jgi:hypothetical protein
MGDQSVRAVAKHGVERNAVKSSHHRFNIGHADLRSSVSLPNWSGYASGHQSTRAFWMSRTSLCDNGAASARPCFRRRRDRPNGGRSRTWSQVSSIST